MARHACPATSATIASFKNVRQLRPLPLTIHGKPSAPSSAQTRARSGLEDALILEEGQVQVEGGARRVAGQSMAAVVRPASCARS